MALFKKKDKKSDSSKFDDGADSSFDEDAVIPEEKKEKKIDPVAEILRLKAQFESFIEIKKASDERFGQINSQIGELRGTINNLSRSIQGIEIKAIKAADLVSAIQPDKLMVEVRKQDVKIEAVKASFESNEALIKTVMEEIKSLRKSVNRFRGVEELEKLSAEVKSNLKDLMKAKAEIERYSDKAESMFIEVEKRSKELDKYDSRFSSLEEGVKEVQTSLDELRLSVDEKSDRKEIKDVLERTHTFENHVTKLVAVLTKEFEDIKSYFNSEFNERFKKLESLIAVLRELQKPSPDFDKAIELLKEAANKKQENKLVKAARSVFKKEGKPPEKESDKEKEEKEK